MFCQMFALRQESDVRAGSDFDPTADLANLGETSGEALR
jgi:hypothetical protein